MFIIARNETDWKNSLFKIVVPVEATMKSLLEDSATGGIRFRWTTPTCRRQHTCPAANRFVTSPSTTCPRNSLKKFKIQKWLTN